jgi:hypothetical protein
MLMLMLAGERGEGAGSVQSHAPYLIGRVVQSPQYRNITLV